MPNDGDDEEDGDDGDDDDNDDDWWSMIVDGFSRQLYDEDDLFVRSIHC